jgi:17beta-estradiol 17-dehydrogenase / very-long-chain 3-oxoacyl-CoA reductase
LIDSLADEILRRGFNVLVHGRSPSKLANVVAWLRARHPARQIDSVIADLAQLGDIPNILNAIKSKNVSIFINNAASTDRDMSLFADLPMEQIDHVMTTGVLFTTKLIHGTLPFLSKTRSIMINVGSQSGEVAAPYVSIYASSKAYLLVS